MNNNQQFDEHIKEQFQRLYTRGASPHLGEYNC